MKYEFYADVFFLTNCYLDFLAVYTVSEILGKKKKLLRFFLGAAASSLIGCMLFLSINNYDFYLISIHFIVNPAITIFCFFPAEKRTYLHAYLLVYFVLLMLGGSMQWFYQTIANGKYYEICLILTGVPVIIFCYIIRKKRKNVQVHYETWICNKGREIKVYALLDTGNSLFDPYTKEPVHVLSENIKEKLGIELPGRLIPFHSVGKPKGMMEVFTVDKIKVQDGEREILIEPAVISAGDHVLFENRRYQMILHSTVLNMVEKNEI